MEEQTKDSTWVVGILDSYGAVHSVSFHFEKADEFTHGELWPMQMHGRWRIMNGEFSSLQGDEFDIEQYDHIIQHVKKKYKNKVDMEYL